MAERRYDDGEVREILDRATELQPEAGSTGHGTSLTPLDGTSADGLTLVDLEQIAEKAGIPSSRVTEAITALELERSLEESRETYLGVALTTEHDVRLPRLLTGDEWDRFVVGLREAFDTTGTVTSEGSLRSWSGAHVTVLLEPLQEGARLRFESKDNASKQLVDAGAALIGSGGFLGLVLGVLVPLTGKPVPAILLGSVLGFLGVGAGIWALGRRGAAGGRLPRAREFVRLSAEARRIAQGDPPSD